MGPCCTWDPTPNMHTHFKGQSKIQYQGTKRIKSKANFRINSQARLLEVMTFKLRPEGREDAVGSSFQMKSLLLMLACLHSLSLSTLHSMQPEPLSSTRVHCTRGCFCPSCDLLEGRNCLVHLGPWCLAHSRLNNCETKDWVVGWMDG